MSKADTTGTEKQTLITDLRAFAEKHKGLFELLKALLNFVVGAITGAVTAYAFLHTLVDKAVTRQIAPYETLMAAIGDQQFGDYDKAIDGFSQVIGQTNSTSSELLTAAYDGLLFSIANTPHPASYKVYFEKIRSYNANLPEFDGWRPAQFGWLQLHLGDRPQALLCFTNSLLSYRENGRDAEGGDALRGLLYSAIIEDNTSNGLMWAAQMRKLRPIDYSVSNLINTLEKDSQEEWFKSLAARNNVDLAKNLSNFTTELKKHGEK